MRRATLGTGIAAGALALVATAPAWAQGGSNRNNPYNNGRNRQDQPQPITVPLPPPSLGPNSLGLLERDFQQMRRTSPRPNEFMGGRWNPQYQTIYPSTGYYGGTGYPYYGGVGYFPYGGYYGGGLYYSSPNLGGYYGGGYGGGYGAPYGAVNNYNYNVAPAPAVVPGVTADPAPVRTEKPVPESKSDDFYLRSRVTDESLSDALDDIRKAWVNGDFARLQAHLPAEGKVRLSAAGKYRETVDGAQFASMLKDAMKRIDTLSFELDRPTSTEKGRASVTGRHVFVDPQKNRQTVNVSYRLELSGGRWIVTEAGSTIAPAAGAED